MRSLLAMASPLRVVLLFLVFSLFGVGLYDYLTNFESNGCEMTYMYQQPEYMKVPLDDEIKSTFPKYNLYFYAEGSYARESENFKLKGVPVLFIPGNAGSYRQVRSLGSVALKKTADSKSPIHFNYFSIDYHEELSGLYGGYLQDQTEFAYGCIKQIMTFYKGAPAPPKTVIIVGHSMGGVIARALFTLPDFDATLVNTIITQATPHQAPVVAIDPILADFFTKVNSFWAMENNRSLADVTVFSTGGGFRDTMVRSGLSSLRGIVGSERGISTNTMTVPRAWVSTDHLCHVWCKQLVLATKRAMFDIVDKNTKQVAVNPVYRWRSFAHHFLQNPGPKRVVFTFDDKVKLNDAIKWERRQKLSWRISKSSMEKTRYSVTELPLFEREQFALVAISNAANEKWIGGCIPSSPPDRRCAEMSNFAPRANHIPPLYADHKVVHVDSEVLKEYRSVVTILPKSKQRVHSTVEVYNITERQVEFNVTSLLGFFGGFPGSITNEEVIIDATAADAVFYNISLRGLDIPLQAYTIYITTINCSSDVSGGFAGSVAKLYVPWSSDHTYTYIRPNKNGTLSAKLQSGKPAGHPGEAQVHLYLLPMCTYRISIDTSFRQLFGQFVRFYGTLIPSFMAIQVLMVLSWQLKSLDEEGVAPSFDVSHARWAQPWRVVPPAMLLRFMITYPEEDNIASKLGLPVDDPSELQRQVLWYPALPVLLYLTCYSFMALYVPTMTLIISIASRVSGLLCATCCSSPGVNKLAILIQCALFICGAAAAGLVCGTLGILIVYFICIIKTVASHIEARRSSSQGAGAWSKFHVHFTLLLLFLILLVLNTPSLVVWAKNLPYDSSLSVDPSRATGVITCVAALLLLLADFPTPFSEWYSIMGALCYMSCVLTVLYGSVSLYRVNYFVNTILILISVPALVIAATPDNSPRPAALKEKTN